MFYTSSLQVTILYCKDVSLLYAVVTGDAAHFELQWPNVKKVD